MSAPVVAVSGVRGGVMATSITANVAGLLARAGNRTLVVDADPAGMLQHALGCAPTVPGRLRTGVRERLDLLPLGSRDPGVAALAEVVAGARAEYDVVLIDTTARGDAIDTALAVADFRIVPVLPDRAAIEALPSALASSHLRVLGVVLAGLPLNPRVIAARSRRSLHELHAAGVPTFVSKIRSDVSVAWSARDRGLLLHELATRLDRSVLDVHVVESVHGLDRDYAELAEEVVVRLHDAALVG